MGTDACGTIAGSPRGSTGLSCDLSCDTLDANGLLLSIALASAITSFNHVLI